MRSFQQALYCLTVILHVQGTIEKSIWPCWFVLLLFAFFQTFWCTMGGKVWR